MGVVPGFGIHVRWLVSLLGLGVRLGAPFFFVRHRIGRPPVAAQTSSIPMS
jgi:hypothetical protein